MRAPRSVIILLVGMLLQSSLGLSLNPYQDIAWIALSWLGNDAVTLFLVCPLLAAALTGPRPREPRWQLLQLGLIGYAIYNYAFYMLGAALNQLFPLYIALFVAAFFALTSELTSDKIGRIARAYAPSTPVRVLGGYLVCVALCLSAVWLVMWALHIFADQPAPGSPEVFRLVAALDLGFMVPALAAGGALLWRRQALGYSLGALAAIQAALYLLVLSVNSALAIHRGLAQWPGELPMWAPLCVVTSACALWLLHSVLPMRDDADTA